jgi:large repetitive protein
MLVRLAQTAATRRGFHIALVIGVSAVMFALLSLPTEAAKGGKPGKPGVAPTSTATSTPPPESTPSATPTPTPAPSIPVFTAQTPPSATVGTGYGYQFVASGSPSYGYAGGNIPPGLSLAASGWLVGTPSQAGSYMFWVYAANAGGTTVSSAASINVTSTQTAPAFTAQSPSPNATVGSTYAGYTFAATGNPAPGFGVWSGTLPPGFVLTSTGSLSGTPTTTGSFSFQVYAANGSGTTVTSTITINVAAGSTSPLAMSPVPAPLTFSYGQNVSYQFTATGGVGPYSFYRGGGTLPAWLSLSSSGLLSGQLLAYPGSEFIFSVWVVDSNGNRASVAVLFKVAP